jgi:hypothetical protein
MTRTNQQSISVKRGPRIAPRPAPAPQRRGPPIAPRPIQVPAPAQVPANMNKIGGTRRKHRRHTKKLKKRTV